MVGGVAVLAVAVVVGVLIFREFLGKTRRAVRRPPAHRPCPEPDPAEEWEPALTEGGVADPALTAVYLTTVAGSLDGSADEACGLAETLEAEATPVEIGEAATGSPDPILDDLLIDHQLAVYSAIAACRGDVPVTSEEGIAELAEAHQVLLQYLEEELGA